MSKIAQHKSCVNPLVSLSFLVVLFVPFAVNVYCWNTPVSTSKPTVHTRSSATAERHFTSPLPPLFY